MMDGDVKYKEKEDISNEYDTIEKLFEILSPIKSEISKFLLIIEMNIVFAISITKTKKCLNRLYDLAGLGWQKENKLSSFVV